MFFTAQFQARPKTTSRIDGWQDRSTEDFYIFVSSFGKVQLHKRSAYPSTFAVVDKHILYVGYGDYALAKKMLTASAGIEFDRVVQANEFLLVEADALMQTVSVQRDNFCTLPLFVAAQKSSLILSNTFEEVTNAAKPGSLHISGHRLVDYILDRPTRRQDTILKEITTLGERERLVWERGTSARQHTAIESPAITEFDSDPRQFRHILEAMLQNYARRYGSGAPLGCEFSGGIDLAMIAGYLAGQGHDLRLATLRFIGRYGASQDEKVSDFRKRFSTAHAVFDLHPQTNFPLAHLALADTWQSFYEREEIYFEAFRMCAAWLASQGVETVLSGIGGDDSLARGDWGRPLGKSMPDFATDKLREMALTNDPLRGRLPGNFFSYEVLMARISHNNVYLEQGIWPVMPLADPAFFLYCQGLKPRFRDNKNIYRMYCHAWQYPKSIYNDANRNEDFGTFFIESMQAHFDGFADRWFKRSKLIQAGLIDDVALANFIQENRDTSAHHLSNFYLLYKLLSVEVILQSLKIEL